MRHVRAIYNTALKEHDLPVNPTVAVHWNKERRRQEPIPWAKLPDWHAAVLAIESDVRRDYQLFTLLTGLRKMDAATVRWDHVGWHRRLRKYGERDRRVFRRSTGRDRRDFR